MGTATAGELQTPDNHPRLSLRRQPPATTSATSSRRKPHSNINEERSGQNRPIWLSVAAKEVDALQKTLEDENAKLRHLPADTMLDNFVLKDLPGKN